MTKNEVYTLRLPPEIREQLRLLAKSNGMAPSAFVRRLIENEIQRQPPVIFADGFAELERARKIGKIVEKIHKLTNQILEA
jgi:predicted DNA-binding protein